MALSSTSMPDLLKDPGGARRIGLSDLQHVAQPSGARECHLPIEDDAKIERIVLGLLVEGMTARSHS
jgi:hypothetical protein